jgi:ABC-type multidrug transport system ATPase subunit
MLRIENVSKTHPGRIRALKGVSLEVSPGMSGLLGPNGAGKTTLMRAVATLGDPDEGRIRFGEIAESAARWSTTCCASRTCGTYAGGVGGRSRAG